MVETNAVKGDATTLRANAVVATVNSDGEWLGQIGATIQQAVGNIYHDKLERYMATHSLYDGDAITFKGPPDIHRAGSNDVIVLVDDQNISVDLLILSILEEARRQRYFHIGMPMLRMNMAHVPAESDTERAIFEVQHGIRMFQEIYPNTEMMLTIVDDFNDQTLTAFKDALYHF